MTMADTEKYVTYFSKTYSNWNYNQRLLEYSRNLPGYLDLESFEVVVK